MSYTIRRTHYEQVSYFAKKCWGITMEDIDALVRPIHGPHPTFSQFVEVLLVGKDATVEYQMKNMSSHVELFHLYHLYNSGERIYHITPGLSARLARTSLNVDSRFFKCPYPEIFVQIDRGLFTIYDKGMTPTPVDGFYVNYHEVRGIKHLRIMVVSLMPPAPGIEFNNCVFFFHLEIGPGPIEDQIREYIRDKQMTKKEELVASGAIRNIDYQVDFALYIVNVLMYLTSKNAELTSYIPSDTELQKKLAGLKNPAKKRKLLQKAGKKSQYIVLIAGQGVTSNKSDVDGIAQAGGVGQWKLNHQVRVSGYWRGQWYGSEKDGSRHLGNIWIEDYIKGPEFAEVINKPYLVK